MRLFLSLWVNQLSPQQQCEVGVWKDQAMPFLCNEKVSWDFFCRQTTKRVGGEGRGGRQRQQGENGVSVALQGWPGREAPSARCGARVRVWG